MVGKRRVERTGLAGIGPNRFDADADRVGRRIWKQVQAAGPIAVPGRPRRP